MFLRSTLGERRRLAFARAPQLFQRHREFADPLILLIETLIQTDDFGVKLYNPTVPLTASGTGRRVVVKRSVRHPLGLSDGKRTGR